MTRYRLFALVIPAVALVGMAVLLVPRSAGNPALVGTILPGKVTPAFSLRDQWGHPISPRTLRGQVVAVTFLDSLCLQLCPLVAETLRQSAAAVRAAGGHVALVAISTDPEGDTRATVRRFSAIHGLLHSWHYLTGPRFRLAPIWKAYAVYAAPASAAPAVRDAHTSATYLIDESGRQRVLFGGSPRVTDLTNDLAILAGVKVASPGSAVRPGQPAPDFALRRVSGGAVRLTSLRGHPVLLNFWAAWCPPCGKEIPVLAETFRRYGAGGLRVVGVDKQEDAGAVGMFVQSLGIPYPIVVDRSGSVAGRYNLISLPTTFLLDAHGVIRAVRPGMVDRRWLDANLGPLLRGAVAGR